MKNLLASLVIGLAFFSPLYAGTTEPVLDAASQVSESLASDNLTGAKSSAEKLAAVSSQNTALARSSSKVASAASLAEARAAYKEVGKETSFLARGVVGYSVVFCSMADAKWVQKGTAVRNPYLGKDMLTCGVIE